MYGPIFEALTTGRFHVNKCNERMCPFKEKKLLLNYLNHSRNMRIGNKNIFHTTERFRVAGRLLVVCFFSYGPTSVEGKRTHNCGMDEKRVWVETIRA